MSLEPSSPELARIRASARGTRERANSIRACHGVTGRKANRSYQPLHAHLREDARLEERLHQHKTRGDSLPPIASA